jgi:hypothetical protein
MQPDRVILSEILRVRSPDSLRTAAGQPIPGELCFGFAIEKLKLSNAPFCREFRHPRREVAKI